MAESLILTVLKARTSGKSENFDLSWIRSEGPRIGPLSLSMGQRRERINSLASGLDLPLLKGYERTVIQQTGDDTDERQDTYEIPRCSSKEPPTS